MLVCGYGMCHYAQDGYYARNGDEMISPPYRRPISQTHAHIYNLFWLEYFMIRSAVMSKMNPWMKVVLVIGGYVLACLVASAAVYVNGLLTPADVKLASGGMSAFGDLILL